LKFSYPDFMKFNFFSLLGSLFLFCNAFAQQGAYLLLDGNNAFVQVSDHDDLDIDENEDVTITLWIQSDDLSAYHRILDKRNSNGLGYQFITESGTGSIASNAQNTNGLGLGSPSFSETVAIDGEWHHIAMVVNSAENTNKIYIDGILQESCTKTHSEIGSTSLANAIDLHVGWSIQEGIGISGNIDELRYWSVAMAAEDIAIDMTDTITGDEEYLLAAWNFESSQNDTVFDVSVNGHNGMLNGGAMTFNPYVNQLLTFEAIPQKYATDPPFELEASVSSGLPITYSVVSGPASVEGNLVTLDGVGGEVVIAAAQLGNESFEAVADTQSFEVVDLALIYPVVKTSLTESYSIEMPSSMAYPLYANASIDEDELLSINNIEFEVNDVIIPTVNQNGYYIGWWTPETEGDYTLITRATASNGNIGVDTLVLNVTYETESKSIQAFDGDVINFDGSYDSRWFYGTYEFPQSVGVYENIVANFEVTCPSISGGCDDWDRLAWVEFKAPNGDWMELFRYITPYGIACDHSIDVTDFASLLQGEIELRMFIDTWGTGGWSLHLDFDFTKGNPEYAYSHVQELWHGNYNFGDPGNLQPVDTLALKYPYLTEKATLRLTTTGHGWGENNTNNAAEFYHAEHTLLIDDEPTFVQDLWNDCNPNPDNCNGQFGTWQYNRAGWCPGIIAPPFIYNLTSHLSLDTFNLSYVFQETYQDYCHPNNSNCISGVTCNDCNAGYNPHYRISTYLISYSNTPIELAVQEQMIQEQVELSLYPNPSNGVFHLTLEDEMEDCVVTIHDIKGSSLKTYFFSNASELNAYLFNVSDLDKGTYFVKVQNKKQSSVVVFSR
jgi:hypothetical protein